MATPAEILSQLLTMKCEGFVMGLRIHFDRQSDFEAVVTLLPDAPRACRVDYHDAREYDVLSHRTDAGVEVTFFGPMRESHTESDPIRALRLVQS